MAQAFAAIFGAAFTVAACCGAGVLVIAWCGAKLRKAETFPLAFVLGASCVHLAVFAVMAAKIAYKPVWWVLLGGLIAAGVWRRPKFAETAPTEKKSWLWILFAAVFAVFTVLYLANAWAPETSPDGSGYHLTIVARYLRAHGFERVGTNMYASLGEGVEMLYEPAFAIGKHSAAALVHFAFLIALALAMFAYGRRIGKPWVGAAGALLVYVESGRGARRDHRVYRCRVAAQSCSRCSIGSKFGMSNGSSRLLVPIGLLAGYAYAAKYTAFVMVPYALIFVAWRARQARRPALVVPAAPH